MKHQPPNSQSSKQLRRNLSNERGHAYDPGANEMQVIKCLPSNPSTPTPVFSCKLTRPNPAVNSEDLGAMSSHMLYNGFFSDYPTAIAVNPLSHWPEPVMQMLPTSQESSSAFPSVVVLSLYWSTDDDEANALSARRPLYMEQTSFRNVTSPSLICKLAQLSQRATFSLNKASWQCFPSWKRTCLLITNH